MAQPPSSSSVTPAMLVVLGLAVLAFLDSLFNYFWPGNGIHGSEGALLVVVSTLLMAIAAALIAYQRIHGPVRGLFQVLLVLDFLGTALAAYFLEAWILLALVALAALAWLAQWLRSSARPSPSALG